MQGQELYDKAGTAFQRSLKIYSRSGRSENPRALWCLLELGRLYHDQGRLREAKDVAAQAIDYYRQAGMLDSQWLLDCLYELGRICLSGGERDEAKQAFVEAQAGYERRLGPENELTKREAQALAKLRS